MEEVCECLDQTVLDIFQTLEDVYNKQEALEQALKDGFFSMSRARYSMGVKRVNADQIVDADLKALSTVHVDADNCASSIGDLENENDHETTKNDHEKVKDVFKLCRQNVTTSNKIVSDVQKETKDSNNLRKRNTGAPVNDSTDKEWEDVKNMIKEIEGEDKKNKVKNPINLFGVLVPQALRSSQKNFEDAVQLCVEIANEKYKLEMLQRKLNNLRSTKSTIHGQCDSKKQTEEKEES